MDNNIKGNDEISLKDLIENLKVWYAFLLTKWKTIIVIAGIGAAIGLTYSLIKKPTYTATLSFALEDDNGNSNSIGGALGLASSLGLDVGGSGGGMFSSSNLTELFKSRSMVEKTLLLPVNVNGKVISLAEMYIQNNKWREKWEEKPRFASIQFLPNANRKTFTRDQDSIMGVMYEKLSKSVLKVEQKDKKISIINIDVSDTDELFAKYFCEGLANKVSDFYVATKSKKARMNMDILERQTDSIRGELNAAITGVAVATDNTFNLNPALNVRKTPSARRQVDVQANTAILTELIKQVELAKVTLRRETPLIQVIDRPILPLPKQRFGKAKGLVLGGFLAGFLTVLWLVLRKLIKEL
ncbi:Wzz/FepE/Etk N-terminal domain-containing protein [Flavobacterium sp. UBA7680]|uniref:Wzz/FepE/Etk N-terminal domain-containing protein n=1 Tax=Flavobacterium sp. UBA7680 TaxID=1946559 RepID=UPI0025BA2251|nr:Wzz/FepE/Etk N-terminal domain-containing protein [Flavobacterium sp. UBA7680]